MGEGIGLITPARSKQVLNSKFAAAYGIAKNANEIFLANPTRDKIVIKKGSKVAEFHPRDSSAFTILKYDETGGKMGEDGMEGIVFGEGKERADCMKGCKDGDRSDREGKSGGYGGGIVLRGGK